MLKACALVMHRLGMLSGRCRCNPIRHDQWQYLPSEWRELCQLIFVVLVFSFYAILFGSIVYATATSDTCNSTVAKLQRLLIANTLARCIMKPYAPHFCDVYSQLA